MELRPQDYLVRGAEYLAAHPGFTLVGRDKELKTLGGILMQNSAHSVLLVGKGGVGCTALCLGLQESKSDPEAAFDVISKRFYWLDSDGLFASSKRDELTSGFSRMLKTLTRSPESVLIIEDTKDFVEAARNSGVSNFINALMREIRLGRVRAILEARDEDLEVVLSCHSDMRQLFTMLDLPEPVGGELEKIISVASKRLVEHHGIALLDNAIETAIDLTSKYRVNDLSLNRAQPERSLNLLDRALTSYRQRMHTSPPELTALIEQHAAAISKHDENEKNKLSNEIERVKEKWKHTRNEIRSLQQNQLDGEELIITLEEDLLKLQEEEKKKRESAKQFANDRLQEENNFSARLDRGGFESEAVTKIRQAIRKAEQSVRENIQKCNDLQAEINKDLQLESKDVLSEFSRLSGIPAEKLNQNERDKLLILEDSLNARVFGQGHVVQKLAEAVRVARAGLKSPGKPQAAFMFLGPSGVGKTELAKALAATLKDDERALLRFDMSEYMEKHASAKLIGAPPGYEGYEAGGTLTNAMRRNPHVVILFDEIEKAHPDVFNIFLQVLDDGRLTDNRGLTVSFSEAIILMTTNIGQNNFLKMELPFDEAVALTMSELDTVYRPEFLNRFNGRQNIVCFNRLDLQVIERIAQREIEVLNSRVKSSNKSLSVSMAPATIKAICQDKYNPVNGARGIAGYFTSHVYPAVAEILIRDPERSGVIHVSYDIDSGTCSIQSGDKEDVTEQAEAQKVRA